MAGNVEVAGVDIESSKGEYELESTCRCVERMRE
jgi:hypothetical protein